ncbi:hypothetical protein NUBL13787_42800 [Klebsiella pneumoniae]|nr:hypothetical protein BFV68_18175 [Enterobacter hormaechei subsp. steigerwaltii]OZC26931.1 hypothetical protein AYO35_11600 [Escherichia coli]GKI52689.1 hypothetical protein NUBL13785_15370 [Klebsiella pneumoniae]GKJ02948.1 hypothetical protein NUBL13787_42800 [Klebsiella pneumoniae]GKJ98647.1 hypothetical protein NUBL13792_24600 [Klebsiella pneumoniae]
MMPPVITTVKISLIATIKLSIAIYETMLMKLPGGTTQKEWMRFKEIAFKVYTVYIKTIKLI